MTTRPENMGIDPRVQQVKHRIRDIGTVEAKDGVVHVNHWHFQHHLDWIPEGTRFTEVLIHDTVAGWNLWELHDIAHGYPCGCGVEAILREAGLVPKQFRGPKT